MPEPGELFAQRYRLQRLLARGGMGSIWVAQDERLSRDVAIKFMDPGLASSDELKARFRREASAAGALRTRHVVQIHDFGVEDDTPYISMELLEGEDLGTRLSRRGRLSLREAADLGAQIARGLRHAHDAGIVHRDLKPQNLFLCPEDDGEIVKILDFGVAKRTGLGGPLGDATTTNQLLGSPQFMSPEQTRARGVDHRTDVWALGVILYRMLTGQLPFQSEHMVDLMVRIQSEAHPPPSSLDPTLAPLDALFAKALAKDAAARFGSAVELVQALSVHLTMSGGVPSFGATPAPGPLPQGLPQGTPQGLPQGTPPIAQVQDRPHHAGPSLAAVPPPHPAPATPWPTPAPRSGATPLQGPSMYGVSPPSLRPGGKPRTPAVAAVGVALLGTSLVAAIAVAAMSGEEDVGRATVAAATSGAAPAAPPEVRPGDEVPAEAAPDAPRPAGASSGPSGSAASAATPILPSARASASAPLASASSAPTARPPTGTKTPPPKGSGEKKLLLTY